MIHLKGPDLGLYRFIMKGKERKKEEKKPSTRRESNPRHLEFFLLRHVLNRCATRAAQGVEYAKI